VEANAVTNPTLRLRVDFATLCCVGPGKIALLEAIHRTGSLSQAARDSWHELSPWLAVALERQHVI